MYCIFEYKFRQEEICISYCIYVILFVLNTNQYVQCQLLTASAEILWNPLMEMRGKNYERKIILNVKFPRVFLPPPPPCRNELVRRYTNY